LSLVLDRFTSHARRALAAAEGEARALDHSRVGTEHLLLGLLRVDESVAARALRLLGVTYDETRRRTLELVDAGAEPVQGRLSFDSPARAVVEDAFTGAVWLPSLGRSLVGASFSPSPTTPWGAPVSAEAPRLSQGRVKVRTEDLLLALLAHGEGVAAQVLADYGVDLERAVVATSEVRSSRL
jgi:ATP-dependent Clp protease ATP-binding subunit ClpC